MADSDEILDYILRYPPASLNPIAYSFLAPNARGLDNALKILSKYPKSYDTFSNPPSPYEADEPLSNESAADPTQANRR